MEIYQILCFIAQFWIGTESNTIIMSSCFVRVKFRIFISVYQETWLSFSWYHIPSCWYFDYFATNPDHERKISQLMSMTKSIREWKSFKFVVSLHNFGSALKTINNLKFKSWMTHTIKSFSIGIGIQNESWMSVCHCFEPSYIHLHILRFREAKKILFLTVQYQMDSQRSALVRSNIPYIHDSILFHI